MPQKLVAELRGISAAEANKQDVVRGKLAAVFSGLPADVVAKKHEETLHANGMCRVRVLQQITERHLIELGVDMGDAILIMLELFEPEQVPVSGAPPEPAGAAGAPPESHTIKRPDMRPFPKLGSTGYPDLGPWQAYRAGLRARVCSVMSAAGVAQLTLIETGQPVAAGWTDGCADDQLMFPEFVNGPGCVPDVLFSKLPRDLVQNSGAVRIYAHLNTRVCAVSEAATGVQVEEFQQQKAVLESRKYLLSSVYSHWKGLRDELDAKEKQSAAQQRRSALKMVAKLPEVMARMGAAEAAHKHLNPGTELPVSSMEAIIEEYAAKYSSVAVAQGAAYCVQLAEAYEAEQVQPRPKQPKPDPRKKIPCRFYAAGNCTWGSKCRFAHEGKPGESRGWSRVRQHVEQRRVVQTASRSYGMSASQKWNGSKLIRSKFGAAAGGDASSSSLTQDEFNSMSDAWLATKTAGVAALLEIEEDQARLMLWSALQEKVLGQESNSASTASDPGVALVVVADTGATVRVIGGRDRHRAVNVRELAQPVEVTGAGGATLVYEMGDLEGYAGLMTGCLIMDGCVKSLCPVPTVCEEHGLGYQIADGNTGSSFTRNGQPVIELETDGVMAVVPEDAVLPEVSGGCDASAQGSYQVSTATGVRSRETTGCALAAGAGCDCSECETAASRARGEGELEPPCNVSLHLGIARVGSGTLKEGESEPEPRDAVSAEPAVCVACENGHVVCQPCESCLSEGHSVLHAMVLGLDTNKVREPKWVLQHRLDGHPYDKRCPWCVQGKLKQKQHLRQLAGSGVDMAGSTVKVDLSGKHEPGVTGSTWALVGVHEESGWGYVGLQQSKSAADCLVSIQDLEVQLRVESHGTVDRISRPHHDDDKAFRGVVEKYARVKGWQDTHTGGYNPNANAKAEVRIGMLKQQMRVELLCCTGGCMYYEQLWDVCMVYCNRIINTRKWSDRESPIARLTGAPVPRDKHWHPFGVYCLFHVPVENRDGSFRPPSEMGIWVGVDPSVRGGARVVPIEWDSEQQAWVLHEAVTATSVRV